MTHYSVHLDDCIIYSANDNRYDTVTTTIIGLLFSELQKKKTRKTITKYNTSVKKKKYTLTHTHTHT